MSVQRYKELIENLLPQGAVWEVNDQPNLSALLESFAEEFCRADQKIKDVLKEMDPREANELIDEWNSLLGLPDECTPEDQDLTEIQAQLHREYTRTGGISKLALENLATGLGFTIDVRNATPFLAGHSVAGDFLTNDFERIFVAGSTAGEYLKEVGWKYYFIVEVPASGSEVFEAGDVAGTPLREFTNFVVQCTLKKLKPAHAAVFFQFVE
jgi:uncharacterized protein YmfQ (DUF2313 family)